MATYIWCKDSDMYFTQSLLYRAIAYPSNVEREESASAKE